MLEPEWEFVTEDEPDTTKGDELVAIAEQWSAGAAHLNALDDKGHLLGQRSIFQIEFGGAFIWVYVEVGKFDGEWDSRCAFKEVSDAPK